MLVMWLLLNNAPHRHQYSSFPPLDCWIVALSLTHTPTHTPVHTHIQANEIKVILPFQRYRSVLKSVSSRQRGSSGRMTSFWVFLTMQFLAKKEDRKKNLLVYFISSCWFNNTSSLSMPRVTEVEELCSVRQVYDIVNCSPHINVSTTLIN